MRTGPNCHPSYLQRSLSGRKRRWLRRAATIRMGFTFLAPSASLLTFQMWDPILVGLWMYHVLQTSKNKQSKPYCCSTLYSFRMTFVLAVHVYMETFTSFYMHRSSMLILQNIHPKNGHATSISCFSITSFCFVKRNSQDDDCQGLNMFLTTLQHIIKSWWKQESYL